MLTTQPKPQYSAKNNVTIHMIESLMPNPSFFHLSHIISISQYIIPVKRQKIQHTYNAPVQVFNGPVFFGGSPQTFQQIMVKNSEKLSQE